MSRPTRTEQGYAHWKWMPKRVADARAAASLLIHWRALIKELWSWKALAIALGLLVIVEAVIFTVAYFFPETRLSLVGFR